MNSIEKLIFSYTEIVRILRENNTKYDSPLSVAIRDRAIETYEQVIFDLEQIKNLPNELRAVNRNETAKEDLRFEDGHVCKYCGALTRQPDEVCYMNPNRKSD